MIRSFYVDGNVLTGQILETVANLTNITYGCVRMTIFCPYALVGLIVVVWG